MTQLTVKQTSAFNTAPMLIHTYLSPTHSISFPKNAVPKCSMLSLKKEKANFHSCIHLVSWQQNITTPALCQQTSRTSFKSYSVSA